MGRGAGDGSAQQRCQLHGADKSVPRKHAIVRRQGDGWRFSAHPNRADDPHRNSSTWLQLREDRAYLIPKGARDGRVAIFADGKGFLIEGGTSTMHELRTAGEIASPLITGFLTPAGFQTPCGQGKSPHRPRKTTDEYAEDDDEVEVTAPTKNDGGSAIHPPKRDEYEETEDAPTGATQIDQSKSYLPQKKVSDEYAETTEATDGTVPNIEHAVGKKGIEVEETKSTTPNDEHAFNTPQPKGKKGIEVEETKPTRPNRANQFGFGDLSAMSVKELKALAQARGLSVPKWVIEKEDLVQFLNAPPASNAGYHAQGNAAQVPGGGASQTGRGGGASQTGGGGGVARGEGSAVLPATAPSGSTPVEVPAATPATIGKNDPRAPLTQEDREQVDRLVELGLHRDGWENPAELQKVVEAYKHFGRDFEETLEFLLAASEVTCPC